MAVKLEVVLPSRFATQEQIDEMIWFIYNTLKDQQSNPDTKRDWITGNPLVQQLNNNVY